MPLPTGVYLVKVNNRNTRTTCKICSKLTIKTPERPQWRLIIFFRPLLLLTCAVCISLNHVLLSHYQISCMSVASFYQDLWISARVQYHSSMTNNLPFLQVLVKPLTIQLPFLFPGTSKLCWCQQNIIKMIPKTSHLHCHIHVCALHIFFFWSCTSHRNTRSNVILAKHIRVDALNKFFLSFIPIYLQPTLQIFVKQANLQPLFGFLLPLLMSDSHRIITK